MTDRLSTGTTAWSRLLRRLGTPPAAEAPPVVVAPVLKPATPATWEQDVLLVCLRCSGKVPGGLMEDGRTSLRHWIKERLGAEGRKRALRVVETSCLGLCPKEGVAAAIGRELAGPRPVIHTVENDQDRLALYRYALAR